MVVAMKGMIGSCGLPGASIACLAAAKTKGGPKDGAAGFYGWLALICAVYGVRRDTMTEQRRSKEEDGLGRD